jgi:type VI protein secretion system component VasK
VQWVVPPDSEKWVGEKNSAYIAALIQLGHSMQDIAAGGNPDPAVYQAASQNAAKAMDAAKQVAAGFRSVGVGGVDLQVERLLEEPVQFATRVIPADITKVGGDKINAELRILCGRVKNTLRKYPFQPKSTEDTTLDELSGLFAPVNGAIWKFCSGSLAELAVKEGSQWKPKDPAKKPQLTAELLTFLNRAQAVTDAYFPPGSTTPRLNYSLRPVLDAAFGNSFLELQIDGTSHQLNSALRKDFTWPAPDTARPRAIAGLRTGLVFSSFADQPGLWGFFRIMGDAEPRMLNTRTVEWKNSQVGGKAPIEPAPIKVEIVQFPGSADVFNPKFYDGLQCPMKAVQ